MKNNLMENRESRLIESFTTVGGVMLIAGAAVYITGWEYAPYFYLVGSLMFAAGQFADRYTGDDPIVKRLRFQQVLGAVFLLLTAVLMFSAPLHNRLLADMGAGGKLRSFLLELTRKNNWIVTLSIGAVFELYSAFRLDHISKNDMESI